VVDIQVYSRPGCHLCEQLLLDLLPLVRGLARVEVRNVDRDAAWLEKFGDRIPVVEIEGSVICERQLDTRAIQSAVRRQAQGSHW
jgi:hypothetical protein